MFTGPVITYTRVYDPVYANYSYVSPYLGHVILSRLKPRTTSYYKVRMTDAKGGRVSRTYTGNFTTLAKR